MSHLAASVRRVRSVIVPHRHLPLHKRVFQILVAAGKEFGADMGTRLAAALSFFTLFSLVPLLFLTVAVVGYVSTDSTLTSGDCEQVSVETIPDEPANPLDRIIAQVDEVAGRQVADQLAGLTCQAGANAGGFLLIGIGLAAFSGSAIFLHVQGVLNLLFHAPQERITGLKAMFVQRGVALAGALMLAVIVFVPVVAVAGVNFITDLIDLPWLARVLGIIVPLTSLALLVVVVASTFRLLTRAEVPWRAARRGGLFTALCGLIGAFLVGFYLREFGGGGALGAIGGVAILLFFFNLMWIIYLFGAEVTKVYADYLAFGDVMAPTERMEKPSFEVDDDHDVDGGDAPDSMWRTGVGAFLIGLATGWAAGRRDDS